jgi:hypothetical protein
LAARECRRAWTAEIPFRSRHVSGARRSAPCVLWPGGAAGGLSFCLSLSRTLEFGI